MQTACRWVNLSFTMKLLEWLKYITYRCFPLQTSGLAGEDLVKALEGLGLDEGGDGGGDDGNILPIMQSIMQNLLSKDVLYPSLKEITTKVGICFTCYHLSSGFTSKCHSWVLFALSVSGVVGSQQAEPQPRRLPALWAAGQNHGRDLWALWEGGQWRGRKRKHIWEHHGADAKGKHTLCLTSR